MKLRSALTGIILSIGLGTQALAATTATSSVATNTSSTGLLGIYEELEKSPLSFGLYQEVSTERDDNNDFVGASGYVIPSLSYKFNDKNSLSWDYQWTFENRSDADSEFNRYRTNFNYKYKGLLTQDKSGVDLDLLLRQRFYASGVDRGEAVKGYTRPGAKVSHRFANGLSLSATAYMAFFNRKNLSSFQDEEVPMYYYLPVTWRFSLSDKLSLGGTLEYFQQAVKNGPDKIQYDSYLFDLTYSLAKKVTLGFNTFVTLASGDTKDGVEFTKRLEDNTSYTAYLSLAVF